MRGLSIKKKKERAVKKENASTVYEVPCALQGTHVIVRKKKVGKVNKRVSERGHCPAVLGLQPTRGCKWSSHLFCLLIVKTRRKAG